MNGRSTFFHDSIVPGCSVGCSDVIFHVEASCNRSNSTEESPAILRVSENVVVRVAEKLACGPIKAICAFRQDESTRASVMNKGKFSAERKTQHHPSYNPSAWKVPTPTFVQFTLPIATR